MNTLVQRGCLNDVNRKWLHRKTRNFPKCGMRYGIEDGRSFLIALESTCLGDLHKKINSANLKNPFVICIPDNFFSIPTLTEVA